MLVVSAYSLNVANVIVGCLTLLTAVISAVVALCNYLRGKKKNRTEKAVELADYYRTEILGKANFFYFVLKKSGYEGIVKKIIKEVNVKHFNEKEMFDVIERCSLVDSSVTKEKFFDFLKNQFEHIDYDVLLNAEMVTSGRFVTKKDKALLDEIKNDEELKSSYQDFLQDKFNGECIQLLNSLEWFSMNITTNLADEKSIYQSLHQTFLSTVECLYFRIASVNKDAPEKYYTHVIELYEMWKKVNNEDIEKQKKRDQKEQEEETQKIRRKHSKLGR